MSLKLTKGDQITRSTKHAVALFMVLVIRTKSMGDSGLKPRIYLGWTIHT